MKGRSFVCAEGHEKAYGAIKIAAKKKGTRAGKIALRAGLAAAMIAVLASSPSFAAFKNLEGPDEDEFLLQEPLPPRPAGSPTLDSFREELEKALRDVKNAWRNAILEDKFVFIKNYLPRGEGETPVVPQALYDR